MDPNAVGLAGAKRVAVAQHGAMFEHVDDEAGDLGDNLIRIGALAFELDLAAAERRQTERDRADGLAVAEGMNADPQRKRNAGIAGEGLARQLLPALSRM